MAYRLNFSLKSNPTGTFFINFSILEQKDISEKYIKKKGSFLLAFVLLESE